MDEDDQKERSPELLQQVEASGIESLPSRVNRYGLAKTRALDVAKYIGDQGERKLAHRVGVCGNYLLFRHYFTVDQVRLHAAQLCCKHLLCSLCAIRRGSKAMQAYLPRYDAVKAANARLRPFLVTLTVKDGDDLRERFRHLQSAQRELWMRVHRGRGRTAFDCIEAAVWSYEVKRGKGSGQWHPHLHMVAMSVEQPDQQALRDEWQEVTGDSWSCDVRPIDEVDPASGFLEVFKYALKFSDMSPADTFHAFKTLKGKRLVGSAGLFRGIEIADSLVDTPLDDLPYVDMFYRFMNGGYSLVANPGGLPRSVRENASENRYFQNHEARGAGAQPQ